MAVDELLALAEEIGFSHAGPLNPDALAFLPEVRGMCAADRCKSYGRSWSCPPACGTLEDFAARAAACREGVLVQSTGQLEDDFDLETMQATEALHKRRFRDFVRRVRQRFPGCLALGSGACSLCPACAYPDAPCRHPEEMCPSMEAAGLLVSDVCRRSGLGYYYGPQTITYTACVLIGADA